jgi:hypothetical protein
VLEIGVWGEYMELKRQEVVGDWRKLYSEELHNL